MTNAFILWLVLLAGYYFAYAFGARVTAARLAAAQGAAPPAIPPDNFAAFQSKLHEDGDTGRFLMAIAGMYSAKRSLRA